MRIVTLPRRVDSSHVARAVLPRGMKHAPPGLMMCWHDIEPGVPFADDTVKLVYYRRLLGIDRSLISIQEFPFTGQVDGEDYYRALKRFRYLREVRRRRWQQRAKSAGKK